MSSSSANATPLQPITVAPKRAPATKQDSCTWEAKGKCSSPVSCEACINTALSDQTCGLGPGGTCVATLPYPTSYVLDSSVVYFPSANFTYCGAGDVICTDCKSSWTQMYKDTGVYPLNKFCQGESGCICVSQCESPSFSAKVITSQCSIFGNTADPAKRIYSAVSAAGVVVIAVTIFRAWRHEKRDQAQAEERREQQEERRRERAAQRGLKGSPHLNLSGWKALQEKLLASEREFIEGDRKTLDEIAPVALAAGCSSDASRYSDGAAATGDDGEYSALEEGLERHQNNDGDRNRASASS